MQFESKISPYMGKSDLVVKNQSVGDIIAEVLRVHDEYLNDYDVIAKQFWKGNVYETCKFLWDFCKSNFPYKIEPESYQTVRSPAAIFETANRWGVDCKHYAQFISGVLDALNRDGKNIKWCYRFASYSPGDRLPEHVFVVVKSDTDTGGEIWIDPVLNYFDQRDIEYFYKLDKKPKTMLSKISGLPIVAGRRSVGAIDWNALLENLLNAGVSVYTAQQQIAAAKAAQAAAAAAGQPYNLPSNLQNYYPGGGGYPPGGMQKDYMPFVIGGVALVALLLIMKRR